MLLLVLAAALAVPANNSTVTIAHEQYHVVYSANSLGVTLFPADDDKGIRTMVLPDDPRQREISFLHELMHACMEGTPHHYISTAQLQKRIDTQTFTEEEIAIRVSECIQEYSDGTAGAGEIGRSGKEENRVGATVAKRP